MSFFFFNGVMTLSGNAPSEIPHRAAPPLLNWHIPSGSSTWMTVACGKSELGQVDLISSGKSELFRINLVLELKR